MKALLKTLLIALTMIFFLFAGMQVGNSMNTTSEPHNGWVCDGNETSGECGKNANVTCCGNYVPLGSGCIDLQCGTDPGHNG